MKKKSFAFLAVFLNKLLFKKGCVCGCQYQVMHKALNEKNPTSSQPQTSVRRETSTNPAGTALTWGWILASSAACTAQV